MKLATCDCLCWVDASAPSERPYPILEAHYLCHAGLGNSKRTKQTQAKDLTQMLGPHYLSCATLIAYAGAHIAKKSR